MAKESTVIEIRPVGSGSVSTVHVDVDGKMATLKCWTKDAFVPLLQPNAKVSLETEEKESKFNAGQMERWITSVNGQTAKAQGGGYQKGGGSGRPPTQRTAQETASIVVQVAGKCCTEIYIEERRLEFEAAKIAAGDKPFTWKPTMEMDKWCRAMEVAVTRMGKSIIELIPSVEVK